MNKSKLFQLIQDLSIKEYQIISSSLLSPIIGGKNLHLEILIYVHSCAQNHKAFDPKSIKKDLPSLKNKTSSQIRLLFSETYRFIADAIVMLQSKNDFRYQDNTLLNRFKHIDDRKLFNNQLSASKRKLKDENIRNVTYHEHLHEIETQEYEMISSTTRTKDLNLQDLLDRVDIIFAATKLRQACFAVAHQSVYGLEYDYGLLRDLTTYIEKKELLHIPAIRLYYSAYRMLSNPKDSSLFSFFYNDIESYKNLFPAHELQNIYKFAINQCIRHINRGNLEFGRIALDLYSEALDQKYLFIDGYLSRFTFKNVAAIAIKIEEYEWAESFTNEYHPHLRKEDRNSSLHFNKALIAYNKQDYNTALLSLQFVDFRDHLFNLAAKVIQLKIYFETDEYDLLDSHLDAMQMYLLRKKVIGYHKTNYKNIIKTCQKLLKLNKNEKSLVDHLRHEISNTEILTEKKWFLSQL